MSTFLFQASVVLGLASYPIFEGNRFTTGFFQTFVLIGIFGGAFLVLRSLADIAKLLAAILDEIRGENDDESL